MGKATLESTQVGRTMRSMQPPPPNTHPPAACAAASAAAPRKAAPPTAAESYAELARKLAGLAGLASANPPPPPEAPAPLAPTTPAELPAGAAEREYYCTKCESMHDIWTIHEVPAPLAPTAPAPSAQLATATQQAATATQQAAEPAPTRKAKRKRGKPTHGGWRQDSGRKPLPDQAKKQAAPAYVHLTPAEKADVEQKARKAKLSISSYIRIKLEFPASS